MIAKTMLRLIIAGVLGTLLVATQQPGAELQEWLRKGDAAALAAALEGDPGVARRLDSQGIPPLFWAAVYGQKPLVDLLIERGADPKVRTPFGTAVHAAVIGGHADIVRTLLAKGADANDGGVASNPPLVLASRRGQAPVVEALLDGGAAADATDLGGNTPLLMAASYGHEAVVRLLLARRAEVGRANRRGSTPLDVARREGHTAVQSALETAGAVARAPEAERSGPYLGQAPPGATRALFAPNFVSTERRELNAAFTRDGRTFFFSRDRTPRGTVIMMTRIDKGRWQRPVLAPFSIDGAGDVDMFVTSDGGEIYFCSERPVPSAAAPPSGAAPIGGLPTADIWVTRRQGDGWGPATWIGSEVNAIGAADYYPTLTRSSTLYFSSNRAGGLGENDIYRVRRLNGRWTAPENLGAPVNSASREFDPYISPDETYLVFASERPGGMGGADLYVSVRRSDGTWGEPINLGPGVNSASGDYTPMVTPDGRYLFLTSGAEGSDDIYWVSASVIERVRAKSNSGSGTPGILKRVRP